MKKLFVLVAALAFSFAVAAQTENPTTKPDTEKTCADWKAENKCPRAEAGSKPCADLKAEGKCPKANAEAAAKAKPSCPSAAAGKPCGGCSNSKQQAETSASTKQTGGRGKR